MGEVEDEGRGSVRDNGMGYDIRLLSKDKLRRG